MDVCEQGQFDKLDIVEILDETWITRDGLWINDFDRGCVRDLQARGVEVDLVEFVQRQDAAMVSGWRESGLDMVAMCDNTLEFIEGT